MRGNIVRGCDHLSCGPGHTITFDSAISGLVAFASHAIPLLIYTTTYPRTPKQLSKIRDEMLAITTSMHLIQPYLATRGCFLLLSLTNLMACLRGCVSVYSDFERSLANGRIIHGRGLSMGIQLAKWRLRSVLRRLRSLNKALALIIKIMHSELNSIELRMTSLSTLVNNIIPGGKNLTRLLDNQWPNRFLPMRKLQSRKQVLVDLSYHSVLSLPIDCSDIFDECWYTPRSNHDKTVISKLLNEVTRIPIAGAPSDAFRKRRQGLSSLIENSRKKQARRSAQIDADLKPNDQERPRKLLLLGLTDAIRPVVLQIEAQAILKRSIREREAYRARIFNYMVYELQLASSNAMINGFGQQENLAWAIFIFTQAQIRWCDPISATCLPAFKCLWADDKVKQALRRCSNGQVFRVFEHFFQDINRLFLPEFLPTNEDILTLESPKVRGVMEDIAFLSDSGTSYRILKFRGAQGERKKWIHYFEAMDAVLFVVDLSAYNDRVLENSTVTIVSESVNLYASIANSRFFRNSQMILLFNNIDRFREKVSEGISVKECYQEYAGEDGDAEAVLKFLQDKFFSVHQSDRKALVEYTHHGDREILQKLDQCFISSRDL